MYVEQRHAQCGSGTVLVHLLFIFCLPVIMGFLTPVYVLQTNFLASEGLQRLILDKEGLMFEQYQLLDERNKLVVCLPVLEAKATEAVELEARLQQSEQEAMAYSQEPTQLHIQLQDAKASGLSFKMLLLLFPSASLPPLNEQMIWRQP